MSKQQHFHKILNNHPTTPAPVHLRVLGNPSDNHDSNIVMGGSYPMSTYGSSVGALYSSINNSPNKSSPSAHSDHHLHQSRNSVANNSINSSHSYSNSLSAMSPSNHGANRGTLLICIMVKLNFRSFSSC